MAHIRECKEITLRPEIWWHDAVYHERSLFEMATLSRFWHFLITAGRGCCRSLKTIFIQWNLSQHFENIVTINDSPIAIHLTDLLHFKIFGNHLFIHLFHLPISYYSCIYFIYLFTYSLFCFVPVRYNTAPWGQDRYCLGATGAEAVGQWHAIAWDDDKWCLGM